MKNNLLIPLIITNLSVLFLVGIVIFKEKKVPKYIYK